MEQWHVAALLGTLTAVGGGLRWFFGWLDRRAQAKREHEEKLQRTQHEHETAIVAAIEKLESKFADALKEARAESERHRTEHLADARLFAQTLASMQRAKDSQSSSPPNR